MKYKNHIIVISFLLMLGGFFAANLIMPDAALSKSERRRLAQLPAPSPKSLLDTSYMEGLDKYIADQFVLREPFRTVKSFFDGSILRKTDTNGLFLYDGSLYKLEYPLNERLVAGAAAKMDALRDAYLKECNVFYSVVPDKNYYLPESEGYLTPDYEKLLSLLAGGLSEDFSYIDITGALDAGSYYSTDGHWRQEELEDTVNTLLDGLFKGDSPYECDLSQLSRREYSPFYGAYYGQAARAVRPDTITWLESHITADAAVKSAESADISGVYDEELLSGMDSYDVFLGGAKALLEISNPHCESGRELIIFRDSFGSSIAPLLLPAYSKITLVDLRYILPSLLPEHIDMQGKDVLFLYSVTIINNSDIIRDVF